MKLHKPMIALGLSACLLLPMTPLAHAETSQFVDVPQSSYAYQDILTLRQLGIAKGMGDNLYGTNENFKRCDFVLMLARLMGWESTATPKVTDVPGGHYAAGAIAAAEEKGLLGEGAAYAFRPDALITRQEMATMLVRALGISPTSQSQFTAAQVSSPFTDVPAGSADITMAYDFGIINGVDATHFNPDGNATREQTAAMLMRFYRKQNSQLAFSHGFYAISSYSQKDLIPSLSQLTAGWSRMEYGNQGPWLNTTKVNENDWALPAGSQEIVDLTQQNQVPLALGIYLDTTQDYAGQRQADLVLAPQNRAQAINSILTFLSKNPQYTGVTIDFEGFISQDYKEPFTAFLQELRQGLDASGSPYTLNCAVPPAQYYKGYDYRAIGKVCDKVILMAHDYDASTLAAPQKAMPKTPLAPYAQVYRALQQICDPATGVEDKSKVLLALSFGTTRWEGTGDTYGAKAKTSDYASIYKRLSDGSAQAGFDEASQSPYITYQDASDNTINAVWYEDSRSVAAKAQLARYFGINGISLWRLGTVPDYADQNLNVWNTLSQGFIPHK